MNNNNNEFAHMLLLCTPAICGRAHMHICDSGGLATLWQGGGGGGGGGAGGIKRGCDTKIICSRLAQLPVRDEDIGRTRLSSFMTQTASSFKLRTQACTLTELEKGVSDSVVAGNHIGAIFT